MGEQLVDEEELATVEAMAKKDRARAKAKAKGKGKAKAKAKGKASGKGKAKAKAKGKGKAKAKAKAASRPPPEEEEWGEDEEGEAPLIQAPPKAKAKAQGFKEKIMQEIGDRSIDELVADAEQAVKASEAKILQAEVDVSSMTADLEGAQRFIGEASKKVEEAVGRESIALARLKAAKAARSQSATNTSQAEQERSDSVKALTILEVELLSRQNVRELEEAKKRAQDAADLAKKELETSKLKEKEAQDAVKFALAEQRLKEEVALKEHSELDRANAESRRAKASDNKVQQKGVLQEIAQLEKARAQREKERQSRWRQAAGLGKVRELKALAMAPWAPESSPKRPAPPSAEEPVSKAGG